MNLFSDEEISVSVPEAAATIIPVKGHQRVVGTKADKIKHLPITEKEHLLPLEEQFCEHLRFTDERYRTDKSTRSKFVSIRLCWIVSPIINIPIVVKAAKKEGLSSFKKSDRS